MDCSLCPALYETKHALDVTGRALAEAQERVERLRAQIGRLQRTADLGAMYTRPQFAERAGVKPETVSQWQVRYPDCPHIIPGTGTGLYHKSAVEAFLESHPGLGNLYRTEES